ncbi:MAG TPA: hypothetical protein VK919_00710 [Solirubrobacterales bacterium]|nr:hypothetical protein [Solirubrobacterales bacterium]
MRERLDPEAYRARLERLTEIYSSMMGTVEELSTRRCPYKDRNGRCTAAFGCRNQRKPPREGERMICAGDDKLDYRSAWDVD